MKNQKTAAQKRGKRNRQRGAELQRQSVRIAKEFDLEAYNRDRGGAQHEKGDIEIEGKYYGCKRRKRVPAWVLPEKAESGVVFRQDHGCPMIAIPFEVFCLLMKFSKEMGYKNG
tara:strand:- start:203 stop:544 length:342 start_codon:yes stop_codon:yes gene_type:complete